MNVKYLVFKRFRDSVGRRAWLSFVFLCLPLPALSLDLFDFGDAQPERIVRLEVVEPYIDMHTGPGRGYPVFHVVEQGEELEILKRKTNWYKVRSADGKTGWTRAAQLARTLKPTGVPVDLPEVGHGDYLASSWRVGFTAGQLESADSFSVTAGYRLISWAGVEVEAGKIFGRSVTSDYYGANLIVEPMPHWVATPFISVGAGEFSFDVRQKVLVDDVGSADYTSFGAGVNYYIGRNFMMRGEYRWYSISTDDDRVDLNAWRIGLNTFF